MQYTPLNYSQINAIEGTARPSMVKAYNNATFWFWSRSLFQRACSVLELELPESWKGSVRDFFQYVLFRVGFLAVFDSPEFGFTFQPCTLKGIDWYYQPNAVIVTNPALQESLELEIGKNCELVKLTPDYCGIWDIIEYYAEKLSVLDNAINMSLINNKFSLFMGARNKVAGQALKKMIDKVNKGEPAIVYDMKLLNDPTDKDSPFQIIDRENLKQSYLTTDQLQDFQTILNNFDSEIGIPTIPYQKKERMVQSEAESRFIDSGARVTTWLQCMQDSFELVNKHYGVNLQVNYRFEQEGGAEDERGNNDADRAL